MIREVSNDDRDLIRKWGEKRGVNYLFFPKYGLMDEHAAIFLLETECPLVGFVEPAIGNPASSGRQIYRSLRAVSAELVAQARKRGYTRILALSPIKGVIAAAQHSGAVKVKDEVLQWEL